VLSEFVWYKRNPQPVLKGLGIRRRGTWLKSCLAGEGCESAEGGLPGSPEGVTQEVEDEASTAEEGEHEVEKGAKGEDNFEEDHFAYLGYAETVEW
jgi:hypothetical protein